MPKIGKILFDVYVVRSNLSQSIKEGLHIDASDCNAVGGTRQFGPDGNLNGVEFSSLLP
jgi:hypothetical protein